MKILKIALFLISTLFVSNTYAQSIIGKWKTIDDETGKEKSIVEIYMKDGKAFGKIIKLFRGPEEDQDPICDVCTDYRKDKKIIGMTVVTDMVKDGDEWDDGEILDPNNGKIYDCKLWVEDGKLQVRGYVAFFFRTQTWLPVK
ncbi:MAG: DUF2147 domain-containing protein [Cyclobacteriaceae bacterium]|nr:DUF2147 domain-containing protein [Cyclobacteriaceae bacterium]